MRDARKTAAIVLNRIKAEGDFTTAILNRFLGQTGEKQRATDLVFGTIRNRWAIDLAIEQLADCPIERIPAKILNFVRIGAYELIYSPQTSDYAIVNEAVENVKVVGGKKQAGFVNAVLRQIGRHIKNRQAPLSQANPKATLPQTPFEGCEFDVMLLPELVENLADYLSKAFSLPKWLVESWICDFGGEKAKGICQASNRRPSVYVRVNRLKTTTAELCEKFLAGKIEFEVSSDEWMIKLKSPAAVADLPGFDDGLFSVQDITASKAVNMLEARPNWTILDLCAAPGTKTTQLAEVTADKADIIATDIDAERLKMVRDNLQRLGIKSVTVVEYENLEKIVGKSAIDAVLLDVPCSNTGVLARRPEVRYRIKPEIIEELAEIQGRLLIKASEMLKQGGKICYSTCSIQELENKKVVEQFLKKHADFNLQSEKLFLPSAEGFDNDGGYAAILVKG